MSHSTTMHLMLEYHNLFRTTISLQALTLKQDLELLKILMHRNLARKYPSAKQQFSLDTFYLNEDLKFNYHSYNFPIFGVTYIAMQGISS